LYLNILHGIITTLPLNPRILDQVQENLLLAPFVQLCTLVITMSHTQ